LDIINNFLNSDNLLIFFAIFISVLIFKDLFKRNIFLYSIFVLPGTFLHELSHFIFSLVLNGKPRKFSILPKRTERGYNLGYVTSHNIRWYNAIFIGLSPFSLLILFYYGLSLITITTDLYIIILYSYINTIILISSIPSTQDFKVSFISWFIYLVFFSFLVIYIVLDFKLFSL